MIKAILFDLDGTLTIMDQEEFMRNYIGLLAPRFSHLISPEKFAKNVLRSTEIMIKEPKAEKTNSQTFFDDFTKATSLTYNTLWPIFEEFYKTDFPALKCLVKENVDGRKSVDNAIQQGYAVAIASNPVMPILAIEERIRWAGLSPEQFSLIPSMESFHFCKPHLGFYKEMTEKIGLNPEECMMVGNHPTEDLAARKIGMKTFYVGTHVEENLTDYQGTLQELNELILQGNF
ncbi:HAD family hydrolase [Desulfitobacterium sp. Sab5]|uniref:HAD family hydrolase n=1 Tax=Desulfitobacterium TaxID=36853 RepID=UPI003CF46626